jgi:biopolymer transport protein ExbD
LTIQVAKDGLVVHRDKDVPSTLDTLEATLRALAKECTGRADVQPSDDVSYQDIVHVMDVSVKTGFVDVTLGTPSSPAPPAPPAPARQGPKIDMKWTLDPDGRPTLSGTVEQPSPNTKESLAKAPVVIVTKTEISVAATTIALDAPDLEKQVADAIKATNPPADSPVILQADAATSGKLIKTIIAASQEAGYDNLLFAVKNR